MDKPAIAIIQARTSSTRLPGKVMMPLAGKPIIWHIYERASRCRFVDKVIVATSRETSDDPLFEFCQKQSMNIYRGSLDNVMSRFTDILSVSPYPYFVRITGDCPLIHPECIDNQILALHEFDGDMIRCPSSSVLEGQGVHSARSLFQVQERSGDERDLEHVGNPYFSTHPDEFKVVSMGLPDEFLEDKFRLTVDEADDYELFSHIYKALWTGEGSIDLREALAWLRANPEIAAINSRVSHSALNVETQRNRDSWLESQVAGMWDYRAETGVNP